MHGLNCRKRTNGVICIACGQLVQSITMNASMIQQQHSGGKKKNNCCDLVTSRNHPRRSSHRPLLFHAAPPTPGPVPKLPNAPPMPAPPRGPTPGGPVIPTGPCCSWPVGLLCPPLPDWNVGRNEEEGRVWIERNLLGRGRSSVLYYFST